MNTTRTRPWQNFHCLVIAAGLLLSWSTFASAQSPLSSEVFVADLTQPVGFVQDPGLANVQYVVQQNGLVRVIENGVVRTQNFLDLSSVVLNAGEQGLLGLALAPDYAATGRFYVNFVNLNGDTVVARFLRSSTDPFQADASSRFDLHWVGEPGAFIDQPAFPNHKGGHIVFGPDGTLYIGMGDGGSRNDPSHNAQNPASLLGKMLRIDVDVPLTDPVGYRVPADNPAFLVSGVRPEIWAFGLRNPWQFSFDDPSAGGTGALIIGDVGQDAFEEIDYEPAGAGGRNYGWRNFEGVNPNPDPTAATGAPLAYSPPTSPVHEYARAGGSAVVGGSVYRGQSLGAFFQGRFFFADMVKSRIWSIGLDVAASGEATASDILEHTDGIGAGPVSAFGTDSNGELYVVYYSPGRIVRITGAGPGAASCPTAAPASDWVCVNGGWVPPGHPLAGGGAPTTPPPATPPPPASACATVAPASDWVCVNGGWLPPGHPLAGPGVPTTPPPTTPPPTTPSTGCTTAAPASDWVCVNGGWLPPGHPLAGPGAPTTPPPTTPPPTTPPPTTPSTGCTTAAPASDWVCVNGGWLPPGHPLAGGAVTPVPPVPPAPPPSSSSCLTVQPDPSWVCVSGGWLPPSHPLAGTGGGGD
jgi:glucose/arabinose dehydrogenase